MWFGQKSKAALVAACAFLGYSALKARSSSSEPDADYIARNGGHAFVLKSGRAVEYFIHGVPLESSKCIVVAIHGAQTTGNLFSIVDEWAKQHGVCIVAPTLPGYGLTPFPNREEGCSATGGYPLRLWVDDIHELLSTLHVQSFHMIGTSLGSVHAAALASLYPQPLHVRNVMLFVAFSPYVSDVHDPLAGSILDPFGKMRNSPFLNAWTVKYLFRPLIFYTAPQTSDVHRALKWMWEGMACTASLIYQPWDFPWRDLATRGAAEKCRNVFIVSGKRDTAAPPQNQKILAREIVGSELLEYDGEHADAIVRPSMMADYLTTLIK